MAIKKVKSQKVIYVGPTLSDYSVRKFQVFVEGIPEILKDKISKVPELEKLFVPVSELNSAEAATRKAGTPLFSYFEKVKYNL